MNSKPLHGLGEHPRPGRRKPPVTPTLPRWCWPPLLSSSIPCAHWDLSLRLRSSNAPQDEALAFPAQTIAALGEPPAEPHTSTQPELGLPFPTEQNLGYPGISLRAHHLPVAGGFFSLGSAHHVDGGKQVPGKYLPAGACGDASFTGFTASKPRPQSLQISFHHFSRGLITPLAAGAARRSQVQPLLIAGIYYLNVVFQLLAPVPAPRVPVPPLHPKTRAP